MKNTKIYIIAEIGINHNGNMRIAKKLIRDAKIAGASAVKFQVFQPETIARGDMKKTKDQKKFVNKNITLKKLLKRVYLNMSQLKQLKLLTKKEKMDFICSIFDKTSLNKVMKVGVDYIKIASSDINDIFLLKLVKRTKKNVILSTGMAGNKDISNALKILGQKISLLHCVSSYPCSIKLANLNRILNLKNKFKVKIGYSDHTVGTDACKIAIMLGAKVIEKHFTYNKRAKGFDHILSADKNDLADIAYFANNYKKYLGSGKILPSQLEFKNRKYFRKGVYFSRDLKKDHLIKIGDIAFLRPENSIDITKYKTVLEKTLKRNVIKYEGVEKKLIK